MPRIKFRGIQLFILNKFGFNKRIYYILYKLKLVMAKSKNDNLGSFVDQITPEPRIVMENFIQFDILGTFLKTATDEQKELVHEMLEIALSTNKQEEHLSLGEQIAVNSLRKMNILV